jgi:hypothetical protein
MVGQRSNQLNYVPTRQIDDFLETLLDKAFAGFAHSAPFTQNAQASLFPAKPPVIPHRGVPRTGMEHVCRLQAILK